MSNYNAPLNSNNDLETQMKQKIEKNSASLLNGMNNSPN
jgi:hypothetical protein